MTQRPEPPVVLVVDDDQAVRNSLQFLLETEGFAVRIFDSGKALLEAEGLPCEGCAVVDYHMPGMSGLDLVGRFHAQRPGIPVVVITGRPERNLEARAKAAGAMCVVEKPLLENTLVDVIRQVAGRP